jgi:DNA anti-recombination protein RmuC
MSLSSEVLLAIVGVLGSFVAAIVYAVRKWADAKMKTLEHELKMDERRQEREEERDQSRTELDRQTAAYIASSTETMKSLKLAVDEQTKCNSESSEGMVKALGELRNAIREELGDGIVGTVRQNAQCIAGLRNDVAEILEKVRRIDAVTEEAKS